MSYTRWINCITVCLPRNTREMCAVETLKHIIFYIDKSMDLHCDVVKSVYQFCIFYNIFWINKFNALCDFCVVQFSIADFGLFWKRTVMLHWFASFAFSFRSRLRRLNSCDRSALPVLCALNCFMWHLPQQKNFCRKFNMIIHYISRIISCVNKNRVNCESYQQNMLNIKTHLWNKLHSLVK